jgi:hypothetical protein
LEPFQKLASMLVDHLDGILNYCRTKVPFGVVEERFRLKYQFTYQPGSMRCFEKCVDLEPQR